MTASKRINLSRVKLHAADLISKTFDVNWRVGPSIHEDPSEQTHPLVNMIVPAHVTKASK
jgi:hypothetical protein